MKKFSLNDVQKVKLIEMCNDLFSEYNKVSYGCFLNKNEDFVEDDDLFFERKESNVSIPWFEICVVELPKRIAESINTVYPKEKQAFMIDMMMKKMLDFSVVENQHPVDYLYEMYQKTLEK